MPDSVHSFKYRQEMVVLHSNERQAVAVVAFTEKGHLLLTRRRDIPVWVLPGGGVDPGETPEEAALREFTEETGYHGRILRKVADYSRKGPFTQRTHLFECAIEGGAPSASNETASVCAFPLEALPKELPPPHPYWIADALKRIPHTLTKPIEGVSIAVFLHALICHPILVFRFLLTRLGFHWNER